jgi:hypothetical protein
METSGVILLNDLLDLFGYTDLRSIINWCKNRGVTIHKLGKKKYVKTINLLKVKDFPSEIIHSENIDNELNSKRESSENMVINTLKRSLVSERFLKNIKTA